MKRSLFFVLALILATVSFSIEASASPGRLDGDGGHTCRTDCSKYGLEDNQYHYHNEDGSVSTTKPSTQKPAEKPTTKPSANTLTIYINGVKQSYTQPPLIENGSTLVPLRGIFENLGASVLWDAKKQLVTATRDNTKILLKIGSKSPTVNGKVVKIDVAGKVKNGSTLVPLRFVSEALGAKVGYNATTRTITITADVSTTYK